MSWTTPKVDWTSQDYYSTVAWNRVRTNMQEVAQLCPTIDKPEPVILDISISRGSFSLPYVSLVNALEQSLLNISNALDDPLIAHFNKVTWYARKSSNYTHNPSYQDWIRWEQFLLTAYTAISLMDKFNYVCAEITCGEA